MSTFRRDNLDRRLEQLPQQVAFCRKCVISNQRPGISFDDEGVCSACRNGWYKQTGVDWAARERELEQLLDQHRRKDGYWDVLVPVSGGKDSGFVAHQLKHKYGMNPLTVTWTPLLYTDIGLQNYQAFVRAGFTNLFCNPDGQVHRRLARLCFEVLGDPFHVFVMGQVNYPFHMALKFGIPLIFFGENGALEYAGDPRFADRPYIAPEDLTARLLKGVTLPQLLDYGRAHKDYMKQGAIRQADLQFYQPPPLPELQAAGIKRYYYSYYRKWTPQENYYYAAEHCGFKPNPERSEGTYSKYASLDDRIDGIHYYMGFVKFGFGRATQDASHEVRDGHITREEGVALVNRYDGEFPARYFQDFLEYAGISEEHFHAVTDSWRRPNIWQRDGQGWRLRHRVS